MCESLVRPGTEFDGTYPNPSSVTVAMGSNADFTRARSGSAAVHAMTHCHMHLSDRRAKG
ncbi:hypothetical protein OHB12_02330 [Nocardia sp. NBC_01730]|uniref:hypothetical protein n=1 Tax=Nocardia sp. NBC_01730 TaxID=2975998 RepID=UPI002E13C7C5|nr:hypothetical protein OHB12_02330 [Nocardia sp. NBC_01730]